MTWTWLFNLYLHHACRHGVYLVYAVVLISCTVCAYTHGWDGFGPRIWGYKEESWSTSSGVNKSVLITSELRVHRQWLYSDTVYCITVYTGNFHKTDTIGKQSTPNDILVSGPEVSLICGRQAIVITSLFACSNLCKSYNMGTRDCIWYIYIALKHKGASPEGWVQYTPCTPSAHVITSLYP